MYSFAAWLTYRNDVCDLEYAEDANSNHIDAYYSKH
jgi:hypothetical protein